MSSGVATAWSDALAAARLLAVDPGGLGGVVLRARAGPSRDAWLAAFRAVLPDADPTPRAAAGLSDERLIGGLDLGATLGAGRPVISKGVLAEADGGALVWPMAERMTAETAARLAAALDQGVVRLERDGVAMVFPARIALVALDEGAAPEERAPAAIADRCAFHLDLETLRSPAAEASADAALTEAARARLGAVSTPDALVEALVQVAAALGADAMRAPLLAVRAARAAAALAGRAAPSEEDAALAARLVLAPRATRTPMAATEDASETDEETRPDEPDDGAAEEATGDADLEAAPDRPLREQVLEAVSAVLPEDLLGRLVHGSPPRGRAAGGVSGAAARSTARGRPIGARPGAPGARARLALIETLRAAAPWQGLRRPAGGAGRIEVRRQDFRLRRFAERSETATIFVVDASGSAAAQRLAEAKGAVERLLAEAYVRRDHVALVAFRGAGAELLLAPTRALARAKRALAGLPGGGGTPLALGLELGLATAAAERRRGRSVMIVALTDGGANIGRDGRSGRARAQEDALSAARAIRLSGAPALLVDAALRPQPAAERLAEAMDALYLPLPRADSAALAGAARALARRGGSGDAARRGWR